MSLLTLRNLRVTFGAFPAVDGVDLQLDPGELLGIVGESGSGKSVTMLALMGLIDAPGRVTADAIEFQGQDLLKLSPRDRRRLIGRDVAMVFQDALTSLNPSYTVGAQIERDRSEQPLTRADGQEIAVEPRFAVPVEQARGELRAVAPDQQMAAGRILHQRGDPRAIDSDLDRLEPEHRFMGEHTGMRRVPDPHIAAEPHPPRQPGDEQDRGDRRGELNDLRQRHARPRSMSIIVATGARS